MSTESDWLSSRVESSFELDTGRLGEVLREYRSENHISQADLAQLLRLDQSYVSKIETGQREVRDMSVLLGIARQLDIAPARLGISDDLIRPIQSGATSFMVGADDPVKASQERWCKERRSLNRRRGDLARQAAQLYRPEVRVGDVPFLAAPSWIPDEPIPLSDIQLEWSDVATPSAVTGQEAESVRVLPLRAPGRRYDRYTTAIRYLDKPSLFENRPSYRLLNVDTESSTPRLTFGLATYFDKLDLSEAIAHELSAVGDSATWADLPLRALVGDPFDLRRRMVMPAIETLTIRHDAKRGESSFLLHWRDPAKVATAAGIYGLIPAGEFQPSSIASWDRSNDFDLWRNMVREYSEELLGEPERDGSQGEPLDYEGWSLYRSLEAARQAGKVRPYFLGVGLDTLTLTATILTVTVFDADTFDTLFGDTVRINAEGTLVSAAESTKVSDGLPFDEATVRRLLTDEPMATPGACILRRAFKARELLLG